MLPLVEGGCHRPLIPLCLGFVAGCLGTELISSPAAGIWDAAVAALGVALFLVVPRCSCKFVAALLGLLFIGGGFGSARSLIAQDRQVSNPLVMAMTKAGDASAGNPAVLFGSADSSFHATPHGGWLLLDVQRFQLGSAAVLIPGASYRPRVFVSLPSEIARDRSPLPQYGDRLQVDGKLTPISPDDQSAGDAGWNNWLRTQGVCAVLSVQPRSGAVTVQPLRQATLATLAPRIADSVRAWCDARFSGALPAPLADLAGGIFLGERSSLSPAQSSRFAAAGCAHLLATAGLHVGILALVLQFVLRVLTVPRKTSALSIIIVLWLYALAAGDRAAVARAVCVACIYYGGILLERPPDLLSSLAFCALIMLWENPLLIGDGGFQLSFCTVIGLIVAMPALMQGVKNWTAKIHKPIARRVVHGIIELECLAVAAQAVSAPLVAEHYNQVSCLGVFANLAACPLMFVLMPAALFCLAASAVSTTAGAMLLKLLLAPLLSLLQSIVAWFAAIPGCAVSVTSPSAFVITIYYACLFAGCLLIRAPRPAIKPAASEHPPV